MQDRVLDRIKHHLDVVRVHRVRKVMINGRCALLVLLRRHKQLQNKVLHVVDTARIARELGIIVLDVRGRILHFEGEQVGLVQEQNYRDAAKRRIVHDRVEDVARLLQTVGALVLGQHLIEFGRRDEEEDRRDRTVEAFGPFLALRPLPTHVHKDKRNVLDANGELVDALGRFAAMQYVLVRWHVLGTRYPVQFVQEIANGIALQRRGEIISSQLINWLPITNQSNLILINSKQN